LEVLFLGVDGDAVCYRHDGNIVPLVLLVFGARPQQNREGLLLDDNAADALRLEILAPTLNEPLNRVVLGHGDLNRHAHSASKVDPVHEVVVAVEFLDI